MKTHICPNRQGEIRSAARCESRGNRTESRLAAPPHNQRASQEVQTTLLIGLGSGLLLILLIAITYLGDKFPNSIPEWIDFIVFASFMIVPALVLVSLLLSLFIFIKTGIRIEKIAAAIVFSFLLLSLIFLIKLLPILGKSR